MNQAGPQGVSALLLTFFSQDLSLSFLFSMVDDPQLSQISMSNSHVSYDLLKLVSIHHLRLKVQKLATFWPKSLQVNFHHARSVM